MLAFNGIGAYLTHTMGAPGTYPFTMLAWVRHVYNDAAGVAFSECDTSLTGRRIRAAVVQSQNSSSVYGQAVSSWGGAPLVIVGGSLGDAAAGAAELVMLVVNSASSLTLYTAGNPSGTTDSNVNVNAAEWANASTLMVGAYYADGVNTGFWNGAIGEFARWNSALDATAYATLAGGAAPETVSPGSLYEVWDLNPAGASGSAAPASFTGLVNGHTLTTVGAVTKSAVTHPITRAVVPTLSGNVDLSAVAPSGTLADSGPTSLSGDVIIDVLTPSGVMGLQPGTITVPTLKNWSGILQTNTTVPTVTVLSMASGSQILTLTDQTTHPTTADLTITNGLLLVGTTYMVAGWNADGSQRFITKVVSS